MHLVYVVAREKYLASRAHLLEKCRSVLFIKKI